MINRFGLITALVLLTLTRASGAVGFQQTTIADSSGAPLELAVWYPSGANTAPHQLELFRQSVAIDGAISGTRLPLIVISHGTGGSLANHHDTALALAEAGFVVASVTHTGDSWKDHSRSFTQRNMVERSRHLTHALDYLLTLWPGHEHIDAERIGAFGHSAGAFAVLVAIGGEPDLARFVAFCREHPEDWGCQRARERRAAANGPAVAAEAPVWHHDTRIKTAVIAAPAGGYAFAGPGLARVTAALQLWAAEDEQITRNRSNAEIVRNALPSPPETRVVPQAGHFVFLAPCSAALADRVPEICQDPPGLDRAAFHAEFNRAVVEFFQRQLPAGKSGSTANRSDK